MEIMGFSIDMTVFWVILVIVFGVIEGLTMSLVTVWFAGGALISLIISLITDNVIIQVVAFFIVSIILLAFTRPICKDRLHTGEEKTNVDAMSGLSAIVTMEIKPFKPGQVKVNGQIWTAIGKNNQSSIREGETVIIKGIEGVKVIVEENNNVY